MKRLLLPLLLLLFCPSVLPAASFHWVDSDGFHAVDQITKVPLEHRLKLPMAHNRTALPFTEEEDRDGSMYVWLVLNQAGAETHYTSTADIPASPLYSRIEMPRAGDIAWWKQSMAIVGRNAAVILTARGEQKLKAAEKKLGKPVFYRFNGQISSPGAANVKRAPQKLLKGVDTMLAGLDKTAEYPLQVKDLAEAERLKTEWKKAVASAEELRNSYPDDPQVTRRLGVLYRRGFTLEMPGAWERAEAYLLRTAELAPKSADAYISLGILYGDTGEGLEKQAETQFRNALKVARKDQLPFIWWGLSIALHKQGKKAEALKTIDRLIKQRPGDKKALKLREEFLKPVNRQE